MPLIISLDPGGTTGWAKYDSEVPEAVSVCACGQIGPYLHHDELYDQLDDTLEYCRLVGRDMIIVCESFLYRNGLDKAELISCEYIGVIRLFCMRHPEVKLIMQTAAEGKIRNDLPGKKGSFVQRRHLERLGLWNYKNKHAMDGYGHLFYYIINGGNPELKDIKQRLLQIGWRSNE